VSLAAGDYRLRGDSPCVNAGSNAQVRFSTDVDGRARILLGQVDMGAYETVPEPVFGIVLVPLLALRSDLK
jgi:hypothetical protein